MILDSSKIPADWFAHGLSACEEYAADIDRGAAQARKLVDIFPARRRAIIATHNAGVRQLVEELKDCLFEDCCC